MRTSGILAHISSLPSKYGIGSLGEEAYNFVDFLEKAGQKIWQTLPITYIAEKDNFSPYKAPSAFSSNYYLIDLDILKAEGFIDDINLDPCYDNRYVDYNAVVSNKMRIFKKAYEKKSLIKKEDLDNFIKENAYWIEDYSNFMALFEKNNFADFSEWTDLNIDKNIKNFYIFLEYIFHKQWFNLKNYANSKGIEIFGDMPIYVSENSSDFYYKTEYFLCDEDKRPKFIAGVPPDNFSATGQIWGNPLYNWDRLKQDNFKWWLERIKHSFKMFDIVRIDHFRGFDEYYAIDINSNDATTGKWCKAYGKELFDTVKKELGDLKIVVEDLGIITDSVRELVEYTGYPNMKILQFAFENDATNEHLPHNYNTNCVCYTGTHDNKTIKHWLKSEEHYKLDYAKKYLRLFSYDIYTQGFIDAALASAAETCIIPLQDYMDFGDFARMNNPADKDGAWRFRFLKCEISDWLASIIIERTKFYNR